jgi:hypothetical protein
MHDHELSCALFVRISTWPHISVFHFWRHVAVHAGSGSLMVCYGNNAHKQNDCFIAIDAKAWSN